MRDDRRPAGPDHAPARTAPAQWPRSVASFVWALVPLLSAGLLSPLPIVHAAFKLRAWLLWVAAALYVAAEVVTLAVPASTDSAEAPGWTTGVYLALLIVPTAHALALRRRVFEPRRSQDPAITAALRGRERREEARAIAANDHGLARELQIGRPDLSVRYDDGGLVDVNHAPVPVMARWLGLSEADAGQISDARDRLGGFTSPEEVIAFTDLSPALVDAIRDRLLFLPDSPRP